MLQCSVLCLGNRKIDRGIGAQSFEILADEGPLMKDYFVITNTGRPILCYAKVLPANDNEHETISKKLRIYNIRVSDYIEVSRTIGIRSPCALRSVGNQLFMKMPYSIIYETCTTTTTDSYNTLLSRISSSNNSLSSFIIPNRQVARNVSHISSNSVNSVRY